MIHAISNCDTSADNVESQFVVALGSLSQLNGSFKQGKYYIEHCLYPAASPFIKKLQKRISKTILYGHPSTLDSAPR